MEVEKTQMTFFSTFFCWRSHKKGSFPIGIGIKGRSIFSGIFFSFHSLDLQHVNQWIEQVKQEQILSSDSFFCKLGLMLLLSFLSFLPSSASAFWCQYWAKQSIKDILLSKQKHHTCRPLRLTHKKKHARAGKLADVVMLLQNLILDYIYSFLDSP